MRRVIIVGGGFGGISVARSLARYTRRKDVEIVVIDERPVHIYTPWLYEVASAILPVHGERLVARASRRSSIPFFHFPGFRGIRMIQARVTHVAPDGAQVTCSDGTILRADATVIAVGSVTNDFGIAGVREFASELKTPQDAERIANRMRTLLEKVKEDTLSTASIVIVGAGANGVELSAELAVVRNVFCRAHALRSERVRVVLCDAGSVPVKMFPQSVQARVLKRLRNIGVEFLGNTAVTAVTEHAVDVGHAHIPYDMLLWSAGVKSREEVARAWNMPVNDRGRICVDATFRVGKSGALFALGDAAAREGERADPQSAQAASAQAPCVAQNVLRLLSHRPLRVFRAPHWQVLLAVGGSFGVGHVFGVPFSGVGAFWMRRLVDLKYFLSVFPFFHAVSLWYRGVEVYGENNRDTLHV